MLPVEKNARRLIGVLLQYFPVGGTSTDLLRKFQTEASLARQSFYSALSYCKKQGWVIKGEQDRLYKASPDGGWREEPIASVGASIGVSRNKAELEYLIGTQTQQIEGLRDEIEHLRDWTSGSDNDEVNIALGSLLRIVSDNTASPRQRIRASSAVLGYRVRDDSAVEFVKKFLQSVCGSTDIAIDHRIEAGELLRKHESPRIASESVRPAYSEDGGTGVSRTEAWRVYERWQLKKQIVLSTRNPPQPGWDDHLQRNTYAGAPEGSGMPPIRVVEDPVSGFRLLDSLLPGARRKANGSGTAS